MNTDDSSFIRDRTNLDKAHELNDQANKAYNDHDYRFFYKILYTKKLKNRLKNLYARKVNENSGNSVLKSSNFEKYLKNFENLILKNLRIHIRVVFRSSKKGL